MYGPCDMCEVGTQCQETSVLACTEDFREFLWWTVPDKVVQCKVVTERCKATVYKLEHAIKRKELLCHSFTYVKVTITLLLSHDVSITSLIGLIISYILLYACWVVLHLEQPVE